MGGYLDPEEMMVCRRLKPADLKKEAEDQSLWDTQARNYKLQTDDTEYRSGAHIPSEDKNGKLTLRPDGKTYYIKKGNTYEFREHAEIREALEKRQKAEKKKAADEAERKRTTTLPPGTLFPAFKEACQNIYDNANG